MDKNVKTALIIGGVILALFILLPVILGIIFGWRSGGWGMMGPMMGGFGWMWLMPIFSIVFLGLIIWAIVASVRSLSQSRGQDSSRTVSALEVLKQRYARGEIGKEEYEEKKKDLA